ncbi:hypothetical protein [Lysinibacillus fusiformis]
MTDRNKKVADRIGEVMDRSWNVAGRTEKVMDRIKVWWIEQRK